MSNGGKSKSNCPSNVQYFTTLGYLRSYRDGEGKKNPKSVSKRLRELLDDYSSVPSDVVVWATEEEYDVLMIAGKQVRMGEMVHKIAEPLVALSGA